MSETIALRIKAENQAGEAKSQLVVLQVVDSNLHIKPDLETSKANLQTCKFLLAVKFMLNAFDIETLPIHFAASLPIEMLTQYNA